MAILFRKTICLKLLPTNSKSRMALNLQRFAEHDSADERSEDSQGKEHEDMSSEERKDNELKRVQSELVAERQKSLALTNKANLTARLAQDHLPGALIAVFGNALTAEDKTIDETYNRVANVFRSAVKSVVESKLIGRSGISELATARKTVSAGKTNADKRNNQNENGLWIRK